MHVIVEQPMASNAQEAREMAETAERTGVCLFEGLHHRHHPLLRRVREIVESGAVGAVRAVTARYHMPVLSGKDARYSFELSGGAAMAVGVPALDAARFVLGDCALVCTEAAAQLAYPNVDQSATAEFLSPSGATVKIDVSIWTPIPRISLVIEGEEGAEITVRNWAAPHILYNAILVTDTAGSKRTEKFATGAPNPYALQLRAFLDAIAAVRDGRSSEGADADNAVKNLELIDSVYSRAGLPPRGTAIEEEPALAE
jgi:predicted dehydrogenase